MSKRALNSFGVGHGTLLNIITPVNKLAFEPTYFHSSEPNHISGIRVAVETLIKNETISSVVVPDNKDSDVEKRASDRDKEIPLIHPHNHFHDWNPPELSVDADVDRDYSPNLQHGCNHIEHGKQKRRKSRRLSRAELLKLF